MASTPSSTASCCLSGEDTSEDHLFPSTLATEELHLALHKEASESDLEKAIIRCKELVLDCDNLSPERKWLVRHLIEIRLRLQECHEAKLDPQHPRNKSSGVSRRTVRGHHFQLQPLLKNVSSKYCDHCTGTIWHLVQAWYLCDDCGYSCHHKCMSNVLRECAHLTITEKGCYEMNICPEEGLSAQKYQCIECKSPLSVGSLWSECNYLRCDYTGFYYCTACHWGSSAIIPARLTHNWDFEPHPVSQATLQLLRITAKRPLINLQKLNPRLFNLVHELNLVKRMRNELNQMRKYLLVCRKAEDDHFLWKIVDCPHLIETPDLYSLQDLVDTNSGELHTKLMNYASIFVKHIKEECELCKGRGHICEICSNDEVLFPFSDLVHICTDCNAVFHIKCFERKKKICPKCLRLLKRNEANEFKYDDDYE